MLGEDPGEEVPEEQRERSFSHAKAPKRALVIVAGVLFNLLLAWILISAGFLTGMPTPLGMAPTAAVVENAKLIVTEVRPDSPALGAGLLVGDTIISLKDNESKERLTAPTPESLQDFIASRADRPLTVTYSRGAAQTIEAIITPKTGIIADRGAIGIAMDMIGTVKLPLHLALWEGGKLTLSLTEATGRAFGALISDAFRGEGDMATITGPVGIIGLVGDASHFGFVYLLGLTAIISINLAIINILPIPALDGGHFIVLIIEAISRKKISAAILARVNTAFFFLLIALMLVITVFDISKLIG